MARKKLVRKFSVRSEVCFIFTLLLFIVPIPWLGAWLLAVAAHELSHYIALRICKCSIWRMVIGFEGAVIYAGCMPFPQELLCLLSGPAGSLGLLLFSEWMPRAALIGFFHGVYNLLPILPLDGGRVMQVVFMKYMSVDSAAYWLKMLRIMVLFMVAVGCLLLCCCFALGPGMLLIPILMAARTKRPCKEI